MSALARVHTRVGAPARARPTRARPFPSLPFKASSSSYVVGRRRACVPAPEVEPFPVLNAGPGHGGGGGFQ
jgi:hypothetical protein